MVVKYQEVTLFLISDCTYIERVVTLVGTRRYFTSNERCFSFATNSHTVFANIYRAISKFSKVEKEMKTGMAGNEEPQDSQLETKWYPISQIVAVLPI